MNSIIEAQLEFKEQEWVARERVIFEFMDMFYNLNPHPLDPIFGEIGKLKITDKEAHELSIVWHKKQPTSKESGLNQP